MIKLIALDVDGTLFDPKGQLTPAVIQAIARARAAGIRVVLATGRPASDAAHISQMAGCDPMAVCLGGAGLIDTNTKEFLRRWDVPEEDGCHALELCLGQEIELVIFAGEHILVDPFSKSSLEVSFPNEIFHAEAIVTPDPLKYLKEHQLPVTKLHGDGRPGQYPLKALGTLKGVSLTSSNDHDFELVARDVHKGRALALLALMFGIPLEQCAAVGDSANDLEMMQCVGTPIAMGNAIPAVKELARFVTGTNQEDGAAQAILWCLEHCGDTP